MKIITDITKTDFKHKYTIQVLSSDFEGCWEPELLAIYPDCELQVAPGSFSIRKNEKRLYENIIDEDVMEIEQKDIDAGLVKITEQLLYIPTHKGGGGYKTIVNGEEVEISKQYGRKTWVAQTETGSIDFEREKLAAIKNELEQL